MMLKKGDLVVRKEWMGMPDTGRSFGVVMKLITLHDALVARVHWQQSFWWAGTSKRHVDEHNVIRLFKVERSQDNKEPFRRINRDGTIEEG